jgi:hypothetical protein
LDPSKLVSEALEVVAEHPLLAVEVEEVEREPRELVFG